MKKIILAVIFLIASSGLVLANNGWYSTLQGTASDVEQTPPPNGVTIAYNTTDHQWEFNYGLAPAGGTTGTCLQKNSNSDYDYSWVASTTPTLDQVLTAGNISTQALTTGAITAPSLSGTNYIYFGSPTIDGSWRMSVNLSGNLIVEKRISGTWVFKGGYS